EFACYPKKDEKAKDAPGLIALGNAARDRALVSENARLMAPPNPFEAQGFSVWTTELTEARDCYDRAQRLRPDNYDSALGLGIVYFLAGIRSEPVAAGQMFGKARLNLSKAYFLRSD